MKQLGGLYKASPLKTSYKYGAYRAPVSRVKKNRETYLQGYEMGWFEDRITHTLPCPWKTMVGRWVSFGDYLFLEAVLNIWGVDCMYSVIFYENVYVYIYIFICINIYTPYIHICLIFFEGTTQTLGNDPIWRLHIFHLGGSTSTLVFMYRSTRRNRRITCTVLIVLVGVMLGDDGFSKPWGLILRNPKANHL